MKKTAKWLGIWTVVTLGFLACEKDPGKFPGMAAELEDAGAATFAGVKYKDTGDRGIIEVADCDNPGGPNTLLPYMISGSSMYFQDTLGEQSEPFRKKARTFWEKFNQIPFSDSLNSVNGLEGCGSSVLFNFETGEILVRSRDNLDNVIGFGYQRTVINEDWSVYIQGD